MQRNAIDCNQSLQSIGAFYRTTFFELIPFVDFNCLNKINSWKGYKKLTPASADVIRGGFFASAKKMTLITVSWMQLLCIYTKI